MFKKTMKSLINNPGLKILSILIAIILWLIVVNLDDPEITKRYTIPVTVVNTEDFAKMGKVYEVMNESNMAIFNVTGKRSYVDKLTGADFIATADLSQIIDLDSAGSEKFVPINVSVKRFESKLTITQKTINMKIAIEDLSTEQSYVVSETIGTPAEGYAIGEVTVSPNLIKLSGPQSVVSRVSRIVASVNVEGLSEDITASVTPVLFDENGNAIESDQVTLSQDKVTVNVQILSTKVVPVKCETTGEPADGYHFAGLEYAPETVTIKGEAAVLNGIHEIVIPGEAIDLEGATADVENSIDITVYLEEGVSLVNQEEQKIAVKALIEPLEVKNMELPTASLEVKNLSEEYKVSYDETRIIIPVRGKSQELENLTVEQIKAAIDLKDLQPGSHTVEVKIVLDEKYQVVETVRVQLTITEVTNEPEDVPTNGNNTGTDTGAGGDNGTGSNTGTGNNNGTGSSTQDDDAEE